ncbi:hypothetical protein [Lysobacter sp. Root690]|uniref:hypothetical protein n=1 Tax=Lysobacter sp. Root690 TaxID=1736588 RepID=UPI0006FD1925|nr:hypothetical protein [Lysobacter sp. Root690]KRB06787.1 hypothetical protein ASD86_12295 [Lysobacter sp. Root690]
MTGAVSGVVATDCGESAGVEIVPGVDASREYEGVSLCQGFHASAIRIAAVTQSNALGRRAVAAMSFPLFLRF